MVTSNSIELFFIEGAGGLNWIGQIVRWIIELFGSYVGLGIIVFTLVLKLITLPLDVYSKSKMRKNSLKMEKMRPQLEKLQKQYQNDQQAYNMKMMELYKKNGYSMFGACLPMIVTLVIFFFVLGAFTSYSQYSNVRVYNGMANAYSEAIVAFAPDEGTESVSDVSPYVLDGVQQTDEEGNPLYRVTKTVTYFDEQSFVAYTDLQNFYTTDANIDVSSIDWSAVEVTSSYYIQTQAVLSSSDENVQAAIQAIRDAHAEDDTPWTDDMVAEEYVKQAGRDAAESYYDQNKQGFLWVKNIWLPDVSYNHPVQGYDDFRSSASRVNVEITSDFYEEVTANLSYEKGAANGYYVLIVISIGTMFLSQFIVAKSNKAQNELQTADGRGKKTQRVMMIVMPIIFGVFSFMYSAAFSIYMIVSNLFGIVSTVLINMVIDSKFKKIEEKEIQEKYNKRIPQAYRTSGEPIAAGKGGKKQKFDKNVPQAEEKTQDTNTVRKGGKKK